MAEENDEMFESMPEGVAELIKAVGFVPDAPDMDEPTRMVMERMRKGLCMTCASRCEEDVLIVVSRHGVVSLFCGGACYQDMQVTGWLTEQFDDIRDSIKFRGGKGDEAT